MFEVRDVVLIIGVIGNYFFFLYLDIFNSIMSNLGEKGEVVCYSMIYLNFILFLLDE